jgi:hypothetical protein
MNGLGFGRGVEAVACAGRNLKSKNWDHFKEGVNHAESRGTSPLSYSQSTEYEEVVKSES